jgi:hypothetical protein
MKWVEQGSNMEKISTQNRDKSIQVKGGMVMKHLRTQIEKQNNKDRN